jgi:uncharacterized protein YndB with AHSA1/START domain
MIPKRQVGTERSLESTWVVRASLEKVWAVLSDPLSWPQWWPVFQSVEVVRKGQADGLEAVYRLNGGSDLRICEVWPLVLLEAHTEQVLIHCTLEHEEGHAFIHLSAWGYDDEGRFARAMSAGAKGLAKYLGVRLLEVGSWNAATDQSIFP